MSDPFDGFYLPGARLVPGPYVAEPYPFHVFVMRGDADRARALLPREVEPLPGFAGVWLLTFSAFTALYSKSALANGKRITYRECAPFVPCRAPGMRAGSFFPEMWPDNLIAILLGREIYGFPKRYGRIETSDTERALFVDGKAIARARWSGEKEGSLTSLASGLLGALAPGRTLSTFVRKQIVAPESELEPRYDLDQLVEIPFAVRSVSALRALVDPMVVLDEFPLSGDVVAAFSMQLSFEFGTASPILDYAPRRSR